MNNSVENAKPNVLKIYEDNIRLNKIISKNLNFLITNGGYNPNSFSKALRMVNLEVPQSTIFKYLKQSNNEDTKNNYIPVVFLLAVCKLFDITVEEFTSPQFEDNYLKKMETFLVDKTTEVYIESTSTTTSLEDANDIFREDITLQFLQHTFDFGKYYLYDAAHPDFSGILGEYYTYFFPTKTDEGKPLQGELKFYNDNGVCRAKFLLYTEKTNEIKHTPLVKEYSGILMKAGCYVCILKGHDAYNEICTLYFRYIKLGGKLLDCRVAEVLTASAEEEYPTTHRMLISRHSIKEQDLERIMPQIKLGSKRMTVELKTLDELKQKSKAHGRIISKFEPDISAAKRVYSFEEESVRTAARELGYGKNEFLEVLLDLRNSSFAERYNKVSKKLDEAVRDYLIIKGYYASELSDQQRLY